MENKILLFLHAHDSAWQTYPALLFHYLGKWFVAALLTTLIVMYFFLKKDKASAYFIGLSVIGGTVVTSALKHIIDRPRPDLWHTLIVQTDPSFPSGHTTFAATLACCFILRYPKASVWIIGIFSVIGMAWSRMLLGVHYPSDVLAGAFIGFIVPALLKPFFLNKRS